MFNDADQLAYIFIFAFVFIILAIIVLSIGAIAIHLDRRRQARKHTQTNTRASNHRVTHNRNYLPRYSKFIPTRQGECYDIISSWSLDKTSDEMIIHNLDPHADNAKMVIYKTRQGWLMRMYDLNGNLIQENNKITTHGLANEFFSMRQQPPAQQPTPKEKPIKTYTIEIK